MPSFLTANTGTDSLYVKVETSDPADIGSYRLRPTITVYDSTGACPNEVEVVTAFNVLVFQMTT